MLYSDVAGAPLINAANAAEVSAIVTGLPAGRSLTVFVLNDRLDEGLCHAIAEANRGRRASGVSLVQYGILSAFTLEQLAWLMIKTWALLFRPAAEVLTFADWDFDKAQAKARSCHTSSGFTVERPVTAPWCDSSVDIVSIRAHGAPFDVLLGDAVLCGHLEPPLPHFRTQRAPSCFHDGICFRMGKGASPPTQRLLAVDATALVWCFDSCASLPFVHSAFGNGTSYAFGLVAGSAAAIIAPYLDITTRGGLTQRLEGLLATGATLGETARAACSFEPSVGFDRFLLIGSPDLRFFRQREVAPIRNDRTWTYQLRGRGQTAWRLSLPETAACTYLSVVGDDGAEHWTSARCDAVDDADGRFMLVTLDAPADVDGWLVVAGGSTPEELSAYAHRIEANLAMLVDYPFVSHSQEEIGRCVDWAGALRTAAAQSSGLRSRSKTAVALASLHLALDDLHRCIAALFLTEVAARDVSLDRIPGQGFVLESTSREVALCPTCGGALYVTLGRWSQSPSYLRHWVQCANCAGIALERADSPVEVSSPTAAVVAEGALIEISIGLRNRSNMPLPVVIAGLPRRGRIEWASGPTRITLSPNEAVIQHLHLRLQEAGVISYRVLVLSEACVGLYSLKHVVEPKAAEPTGALSHDLFSSHDKNS